MRTNARLVIGSRFLDGASAYRISGGRRFVMRLLSRMVRRSTGFVVRDTTSASVASPGHCSTSSPPRTRCITSATRSKPSSSPLAPVTRSSRCPRRSPSARRARRRPDRRPLSCSSPDHDRHQRRPRLQDPAVRRRDDRSSPHFVRAAAHRRASRSPTIRYVRWAHDPRRRHLRRLRPAPIARPGRDLVEDRQLLGEPGGIAGEHGRLAYPNADGMRTAVSARPPTSSRRTAGQRGRRGRAPGASDRRTTPCPRSGASSTARDQKMN